MKFLEFVARLFHDDAGSKEGGTPGIFRDQHAGKSKNKVKDVILDITLCGSFGDEAKRAGYTQNDDIGTAIEELLEKKSTWISDILLIEVITSWRRYAERVKLYIPSRDSLSFSSTESEQGGSQRTQVEIDRATLKRDQTFRMIRAVYDTNFQDDLHETFRGYFVGNNLVGLREAFRDEIINIMENHPTPAVHGEHKSELNAVLEWLNDETVTPEDRKALYEKLFQPNLAAFSGTDSKI